MFGMNMSLYLPMFMVFFSNQKATLTIVKATKNDTGVFVCLVNNGVGQPSTSNVTVIVRSKPQVDRSQVSFFSVYIVIQYYIFSVTIFLRSPQGPQIRYRLG